MAEQIGKSHKSLIYNWTVEILASKYWFAKLNFLSNCTKELILTEPGIVWVENVELGIRIIHCRFNKLNSVSRSEEAKENISTRKQPCSNTTYLGYGESRPITKLVC